MLNKLVDVFLDFIGWFVFWVVVDPTEMGVVYSLGRDTKIFSSTNGLLGSGLHFIAPFDLETVVVTSIQWDWDSVAYQSLTTKDGKPIIVQVGYRYRLRPEPEKVRKFIVGLNHETETRRMAIGAAVANVVEQTTLEELRKDEMSEGEDKEGEQQYTGVKRTILKKARKELTYWGYQITHFEWLQRTDSRTYRFMQDQINTISTRDAEESS